MATDDLWRWKSGVLEAGQNYRLRLNTAGEYSYTDSAHPLNRAVILVEETKSFCR